MQSTLNTCAQTLKLYLLIQSPVSEARTKSPSKRKSSTSESPNPPDSHVSKPHPKPSLSSILTHPSRGRILRSRHNHRHHIRHLGPMRSDRHAGPAQRRQSNRLLSNRKRLIRLHLHRHCVPERRDQLQLSREGHSDERCLQPVFHDVEGTGRSEYPEQSRTSVCVQRGDPDDDLFCDSGPGRYIEFDREQSTQT